MNGRTAGLLAAASAVVALVLGGPEFASGTHQPADKAVASASKVVAVGPGVDVELLRATLRTSKPSDLLLEVTLECSILTRLVTGGDKAQSSTATGDVRVWVEFDGRIVPLKSVSRPPQDRDGVVVGNDSDKVTFCNRTYSRSVTDTENDDDGTDRLEDYIDTKSANGFNWMLLNAGNGIHTVVVKADLAIETAGDAVAEALIGNRTLIVQPLKLANDAVV